LRTTFILIGAGGHGHVVLEAALISGLNPKWILDETPKIDSGGRLKNWLKESEKF
jgi:hypothetical protein